MVGVTNLRYRRCPDGSQDMGACVEHAGFPAKAQLEGQELVPFLLTEGQVPKFPALLGVRLLPSKLKYKFIDKLQQIMSNQGVQIVFEG